MIPIAEYGLAFSSMSEAQFCAQHPHPVLVHCADSSSPLKPLDATRGLTIDRLVLEGNDGPILPPLQSAYTVFPLQARLAGNPRIAIGCSHTCDVQISDTSISRVHAFLERRGEEYVIWDNSSASGTQVNGEVIDQSDGTELLAGDRVTLGFVDFLFLQPRDFYRLLSGLFAK